jgi:hypothetical protein
MWWLQRGECVAERRQAAVGDFDPFGLTTKQQQNEVTNNRKNI